MQYLALFDIRLVSHPSFCFKLFFQIMVTRKSFHIELASFQIVKALNELIAINQFIGIWFGKCNGGGYKQEG